ncbi:hypothetical protein [Pseudarthrobacter sp. NPDC080039]
MAELVLRQGSEMELDAFIRVVPILNDFDEVILGWAVEQFSRAACA